MTAPFYEILDRFQQQRLPGAQVDPTQLDSVVARDLSLVTEAGQMKRLETEKPVESIGQRVGPDGKMLFDVKGLNEMAMAQLQELIQRGSQQKQMEVELQSRLRAKRDVMEKHPVITQLGRVAAAAANAYQAPHSRGEALVRGAGAVATEYFRDTPLSLSGELAESERRAVATQVPIASMVIAEQRTQNMLEREKLREERLIEMERIREEKARRSELSSRMVGAIAQAGQGLTFPPGTIRQSAITGGATPEEADAYEAQAQAAAAAHKVKKNEDSARTLEQQKEYLRAQADYQIYVEREREKLRQARDLSDAQLGVGMKVMDSLAQEHSKIFAAYQGGISELDSWAKMLRQAGAVDFQGQLGDVQAGRKLQSIFSRGTVLIENEKGKREEVPVLDIFTSAGYKDVKDVQAARKKVSEAVRDIGYYRTRSKEIDNSFEARRKTLPKEWRDAYPPILPRAGALPPPAEVSHPVPPKPAPGAAAASAAVARSANSGPPPPNPAFPRSMGQSSSPDGVYNDNGKRIIVINGQMWGQ